MSPEAPRCGGDEGNDQRRIPNGGERDEDRASVGLVGQESRQLDRESRLAGASRADDREQPGIALEPERGGVEELALAAEKVRRRSGEVDGTRCPQRWELARAELEQLRRGIEVLQAVAPEVAQRLILHERCRRGREDHLAAVGEGGDARAAVDVDPDVALGRNARVCPCEDPSAPRSARARAPPGPRRLPRRLRLPWGTRRRRRHPGCRPRHHPAARECVAQHAAVLGKRIRVAAGAELPEQPRRALDVREQQRDRSRRKGSRHARSIAQVRSPRGLRREDVEQAIDPRHRLEAEPLEDRPATSGPRASRARACRGLPPRVPGRRRAPGRRRGRGQTAALRRRRGAGRAACTRRSPQQPARRRRMRGTSIRSHPRWRNRPRPARSRPRRRCHRTPRAGCAARSGARRPTPPDARRCPAARASRRRR